MKVIKKLVWQLCAQSLVFVYSAAGGASAAAAGSSAGGASAGGASAGGASAGGASAGGSSAGAGVASAGAGVGSGVACGVFSCEATNGTSAASGGKCFCKDRGNARDQAHA